MRKGSICQGDGNVVWKVFLKLFLAFEFSFGELFVVGSVDDLSRTQKHCQNKLLEEFRFEKESCYLEEVFDFFAICLDVDFISGRPAAFAMGIHREYFTVWGECCGVCEFELAGRAAWVCVSAFDLPASIAGSRVSSIAEKTVTISV